MITASSLGGLQGERMRKRRFKLKSIGRDIMAMRGGKKKKKKTNRGGRRRK
jgi:hypothetical protein|tara:strand:- start:672 stop:824 length:153 start_codon:yes stop_codon:yes gene_type:complete